MAALSAYAIKMPSAEIAVTSGHGETPAGMSFGAPPADGGGAPAAATTVDFVATRVGRARGAGGGRERRATATHTCARCAATPARLRARDTARRDGEASLGAGVQERSSGMLAAHAAEKQETRGCGCLPVGRGGCAAWATAGARCGRASTYGQQHTSLCSLACCRVGGNSHTLNAEGRACAPQHVSAPDAPHERQRWPTRPPRARCCSPPQPAPRWPLRALPCGWCAECERTAIRRYDVRACRERAHAVQAPLACTLPQAAGTAS